MSWTNPDSFRGKLTLNAIDKLVLGLLAGLIIFGVQQCEATRDEAFQERLAVSQVETKVIADAISAANTHMQSYLAIVEPIVAANQQLSAGQSNEVARLHDQMRLTLAIAKELTPTGVANNLLGDAAEQILDGISALNRTLRQSINASPRQVREEELEAVNGAYRAVLAALRGAVIAAAEITREEAAQ